MHHGITSTAADPPARARRLKPLLQRHKVRLRGLARREIIAPIPR
jgi:hypothetical protein